VIAVDIVTMFDLLWCTYFHYIIFFIQYSCNNS